MDFRRLLKVLAVLVLLISLLMPYLWLPWPFSLMAYIGIIVVCVLISIPLQRWIAPAEPRQYTAP